MGTAGGHYKENLNILWVILCYFGASGVHGGYFGGF